MRMQKRDYMKLSDYLNSLVGKEFTSESIRVISGEVDGIKARATEKVSEKLTAVQNDLKTANESLDTYKNAEADVTDKAEFIKQGGHESKWESFKKDFNRDAETGKYDFEGKIKSFPSLAKEAVKAYNVNDATQQNNNSDDGENLTSDELAVT